MKFILLLIFFAGLTYFTSNAATMRYSSSANTTTPKIRKTTNLTVQSRKNSTPKNGRGRVIVTRIGTASNGTLEQQCQCVLFYLCDQHDVLELSQSGQNCNGQWEVCCLLPFSDLNEALPINSVGTQPRSNTNNQAISSSNRGPLLRENRPGQLRT